MDRVKSSGSGNLEQLQTRKNGESDRTNQFQAIQNAGTRVARETDGVKVSDRANEVSRMVEKISDLPPIRQDRVNALRASVASGSYRPEARKIADAILREDGGI